MDHVTEGPPRPPSCPPPHHGAAAVCAVLGHDALEDLEGGTPAQLVHLPCQCRRVQVQIHGHGQAQKLQVALHTREGGNHACSSVAGARASCALRSPEQTHPQAHTSLAPEAISEN